MLTVAIVSGDLTSSAQLVANLEQSGMVKEIRHWSPTERVPESPDSPPHMVFVDLPRDAEAYFAFAAMIRRAYPSAKLVACSSVSPPSQQYLLEAMRSGIQDFIAKPIRLEVLKEILVRCAKDVEAEARPSQNKLVVLMGAKGGVGTTTIAVNVGVQLATSAHMRVAILDFAQPLGNVHLLLDLHPRFGIRDAVENLDRLDSHFFTGLLTKHKTKLEVLCGASQPEELQTISVSALERVVNVAQNEFDIVLLDMGSQFSSDWSSILQGARMIGIVAEANVPALWTLDRRLVALSGLGVDADRARVIINRWHKADEDVLKSIEKNIKRPVFACIPNDFRKANEAVNLGTPILDNHNNILSNRYRQIASQLAGLEQSPSAKKGSLGGFFSFSTKK